MFKTQVFLGIVFLILGIYFIVISFLVFVKINIYADYLIAYKLLNNNKIPFNNIKDIIIENRYFVGEGRFSTREALVVSYIESSGYGGELIFNYDEDMYNHLQEMIKSEKNYLHDNKNEETNNLS
ncbi:MAG: hypothetical protein PHU40_11815 [Sulfurimonas sp.]|nr:hypothetical protein [Sulfurimonas sp.]